MSRFPAAKVLFPFVAGILLWRFVGHVVVPVIVIALVIVAFAILRQYARTPERRMRFSTWRYPLIATTTAAVAMVICHWSEPTTLPSPICNKGILSGRIESVKFNVKSMDMRVKLLGHSLDSLDENISNRNATVKLTTRGCDYTLQCGDIIAWKANLEPITNLGNPDEIDYAAIERGKGVVYSQFVEMEHWTRIGSRPTWLNRMSNVRSQTEVAVLNTSIDPALQQFIIALLLGNDDFIDRDTRQEFAIAGVAHVLALSGLHVGIIGLVLYFFLFPLDYLHMRRLRLVLTLAAVVLFDIFTGMAPSVIRATVMMAMLMAPAIFHRKAVPLNSLIIAALIILTANPAALYNAGFQLSFVTVGFILLFSDVIKRYQPSRKWLATAYSTLATTVVATLSTTMLSAYYFNNLNYGSSVLANLIILPLFPVFMVAAVAFLLMAVYGSELSLLNKSLEWMYDAMLWVVRHINGFGLHTSISVDLFTVLVFYAALLLFVVWLYRRKNWLLLAALALVPVILVETGWREWNTPRHGMVIFNSYSTTPILYYHDNRAWLWEPDSHSGTADTDAFRRYHGAFLARHHIDSITPIDTALVEVPGGAFRPPFATLEGKTMMAAGAGNWRHAKLNGTMPALDYLIVTRRYHNKIATLRQIVPAKMVVLSGDVYHTERKGFLRQLDSIALPYHDVASQGAVIHR